MERKQRAECVLALIKPFSEYDPFSNSKQKPDVGHGLDNGSPYNFQGFITRILTYGPEHWAAIPNAAVCLARHGFVCIEDCRVQCCECKAEIEMKQNTSGKKEIARVAEKFHEKYCKWRYACTPNLFFRIPSIPGKLYQDLKATWEDLIDLGPSLPMIHYSTLTTSNSFPDFVKCMLESIGSVEGVVQTSALLLALCGWVKRSKSVIQCNFCQRQCAIWNFFSAEDDGWTLCPTREHVCKEIMCNISLEGGQDTDGEDSILCCETLNVNDGTTSIGIRSGMPCETEKGGTRSVDSNDSSESGKWGPSFSNYNEGIECLGSVSELSDREEGSSILSEGSIKNVSSSDSCRTSKSLIVLNARRKNRIHPVSFPTKNRKHEENDVKCKGRDGWNHELREAEKSCVEKFPDDTRDEAEDVLDEENESDYIVDESIDSEFDERDDGIYYDGTEDEKSSAKEKVYWSEETSSENELCSENVDDNNPNGRSISQSSVECVDNDSTCEESCIISCNKRGINNTSDLENMSGEPMYVEDEFTLCPKIDHPESSKNQTMCYPFILHHSNEKYSTGSVHKTESSVDNFPKIVSTMTLQIPESNNMLSPKKDDCNSSDFELIIQPELSPSVDNTKLAYSSNGKLNVNDKNIETINQREECTFSGDKAKVLTNLSPVPDCVLFVNEDNDTNEIHNITFSDHDRELRTNEKNGETNSEPETSDIVYVVLSEEGTFENKNQPEIFSEAKSSNKLKIIDLEVYEINNNVDIAINENKFSENETQPEVVPFENNINQTELITDIKCASGITVRSVEAPQHIIQGGHISCSENISINNVQGKSEHIFECHEKTETIEQSTLQLPLHSIANDITGKNLMFELDKNLSELADTSSCQENNSISEVMQIEYASDADTDSLCTRLNDVHNDQSDLSFVNIQVGDKSNLDEHCLGNMEIIQSAPSVLDSSVKECCSPEDSKSMNEKQDNLKNNDTIALSQKSAPISDTFEGDKSKSINDSTYITNISSQPEESVDIDQSSSMHVLSMPKYEMCSVNNCDQGKETSDELQQRLDDCSITFTSKKKDSEDDNPVSCEEIIIQECCQHDDTIENSLPMNISEEDSKKLSEDPRVKEASRNSKRKYEEVQGTDEINEHPAKMIKLDVRKSSFHPVFEHRFWCIWRTNHLSSDYQKKRGWEFALECVQEYLKDHEISEKFDKFEQYLQCLETLYKY